MAAKELREGRQLSLVNATVPYYVNAGVDTAREDPALPVIGSTRTFNGRNLVLVNLSASEIGPNDSLVTAQYGPPGDMLGGDIQPSEPSFTDKAIDFTTEPLEIPYYQALPAVTESGTPYVQYVRRPRTIPRGVMVVEVTVNITDPGLTEIQATNGQLYKLHSLGGQQIFLLEGAQWQQVSALQWQCTYSWRASEPYTPPTIAGLIGPTDPLPAHAVYEDIRGALTGTGGDQIEGPPEFYVNGVYDNGNINALPGNPAAVLT